MVRKIQPTATERWIEALKIKRAEDIQSGRYFDGQERENIISFDRKAAEKYSVWDCTPSDYNPE